ncbi:MAG: tRNA (adenosine(37)-N6)-threonylcarbamoyltransferase complex transferase subunit TsaD [Alphaproteobacteria bacterium]
MKILGIESSCDESAIALVETNAHNDFGAILHQEIFSQFDAHREYGGVVPEIAARHHVEILPKQIESTLRAAKIDLGQVDGFAATTGPGLIGGLMVASVLGKAMAMVHQKPFFAINHLEGHALTARLVASDDAPVHFPYMLLLVSGGHCQIIAVEGVGRYHLLATTLDDAVGEAFDKTAKLLGLGYPGGPAVEQAAKKAQNPNQFPLPRPMMGKPDPNFSFSGLKAAVRRAAITFSSDLQTSMTEMARCDLAASFQNAVCDIMVDRLAVSLKHYQTIIKQPPSQLVVAGGVAANQALRTVLTQFCADHQLRFTAPLPALCADNAAMIAWAGLERLRLGGAGDSLDAKSLPRWPLSSLTPPILNESMR